jgi:hypothetical protein
MVWGVMVTLGEGGFNDSAMRPTTQSVNTRGTGPPPPKAREGCQAAKEFPMQRFFGKLANRLRQSGRVSGRNQLGRKPRFSPQIEVLEQREVLSVSTVLQGVAVTGVHVFKDPGPQPTAAGLALINSLPDATVSATALADYQRDGQITRNDMLDIWSSSTIGFTDLSNTALTSLQTLVKNGTTVAMPDYVQNLASKVLAGISGGGPSPAQILHQHVNNFFLGTVRPDLGENYLPVNKPLWNVHASWQDVNQNYYSRDNWLLTGLEEVAYSNTNDIVCIPNGDNTYTVRFYHGGTPDYVTVDNYLPEGGDELAGGDSSVLWVGLMIKAYAQENATGWLGAPQPGVDSYAALFAPTNGGNPAWVFSALSGRSSGVSAISSDTNVMEADAIASAWEQGHFVALKTLNNANLVGTTGADPLFYTECNGDSNCGGYLPPPRWYAVVNFVEKSDGGWFTVTEDGKRLIEFNYEVLADNFDLWAQGAGGTVPVARQNSAPDAILIAGVTYAGVQPAMAAQQQIQPNLPQNVITAVTAHAESPVGKDVLPAAKTHGGATSADAA